MWDPLFDLVGSVNQRQCRRPLSIDSKHHKHIDWPENCFIDLNPVRIHRAAGRKGKAGNSNEC